MTNMKKIIVITFIACIVFTFSSCTNKYGADWRHVDGFIEAFLFNEPPEIDDSISNEKELFDYAFKELNLDDTFSLYEFRGDYDAEGNMAGMWNVTFGRMDEDKDKVTLYYLNIDMDSGKCFEWSNYRRNLSDRDWTTAFEDTYKDGRSIIEEIKSKLGDRAENISYVAVYGDCYDGPDEEGPSRVRINGFIGFEDGSRIRYLYDCYTGEVTINEIIL